MRTDAYEILKDLREQEILLVEEEQREIYGSRWENLTTKVELLREEADKLIESRESIKR